MPEVVAARTEAGRARRLAGDGRGGRVDRETVTADVVNSWYSEVTLWIAIGIVLKVYVGSAEDWSR